MKVKCIDNYGWTGWLTMGKTYDLIDEDDGWYCIIDDDNDKIRYPGKWFKSLYEIRNEKINKLLK